MDCPMAQGKLLGMDCPQLRLPRSLLHYSSSGCSTLFYLCFGIVGEAPLIPLTHSDSFHIMEIQDLCKTHMLLTHPQTPLQNGGNNSTGHDHTLQPRGVHLSKPKQSMQQCTSPLMHIFLKIISSFLQHPCSCALLPMTNRRMGGELRPEQEDIAGTPASSRLSAVQPGRAERGISDS